MISKQHNRLKTEIHTVMPNGVKLWANPLATRYRLDEIEGIPLTPEMLEKFGFVLVDYIKPCNVFSTDLMSIAVINGEYVNQVTGTRVKLLHQLQNLYYALTGQELQISL